MSEAPDQPVAAETPAPGVEAEAPATTPTDDIETEAFDRMEVPAEDAEGAGDGDPPASEETDKPTEAADPETIELDVGGQKVKVPKAIEPFLLMQQDYTKKTQDLAEQRRAVEAKETELASKESQQAESLKAFRAEHAAIAGHEASIAAIDTQLAEYRKLTAQDWTNLKASDPATYTQHADNYDFLKRTRDASSDALKAAQDDLTTKETARTESQKAARTEALSKAWGETTATLAAKIEGWTPAKGQEIGKFMVEQLGVTPEELREATDSRVWIMADRLMRAEAKAAQLETSAKQSKATETALKTQATTPAAKPAGTGAAPRGVHDQLSDQEWFRRRTAQKARR